MRSNEASKNLRPGGFLREELSAESKKERENEYTADYVVAVVTVSFDVAEIS